MVKEKNHELKEQTHEKWGRDNDEKEVIKDRNMLRDGTDDTKKRNYKENENQRLKMRK
jgi:hypothetical protein